MGKINEKYTAGLYHAKVPPPNWHHQTLIFQHLPFNQPSLFRSSNHWQVVKTKPLPTFHLCCTVYNSIQRHPYKSTRDFTNIYTAQTCTSWMFPTRVSWPNWQWANLMKGRISKMGYALHLVSHLIFLKHLFITESKATCMATFAKWDKMQWNSARVWANAHV